MSSVSKCTLISVYSNAFQLLRFANQQFSVACFQEAMPVVDVSTKLKELLRAKACSARIEHSKASTDIGFFFDGSVLQSEDTLEAAVALHLDFILAVIRAGIMLDVTRTMCSEAVEALNGQHDGELFCNTLGSKHEWLRNEGSVLKKLFGFVRLKEDRAIDLSRQGPTMKLCCQEYRRVKQQHQGKRGRSAEPPSSNKKSSAEPRSSRKKISVVNKPLWEMTAADIAQAMGSAGTGPRKHTAVVEDLDTPQAVRASSSSSEEEGYAVVAQALLQDTDSQTQTRPIEKIIYYHDYGNMKLCRTFASGRIEVGELTPADPCDNFLWLKFPDGIERESEFPNVSDPFEFAKPAAKASSRVLKRPASRAKPQKVEAKSQPAAVQATQAEEPKLVPRMFPEDGDVGSEKSEMDCSADKVEDLEETGSSAAEEGGEEEQLEDDPIVEVEPKIAATVSGKGKGKAKSGMAQAWEDDVSPRFLLAGLKIGKYSKQSYIQGFLSDGTGKLTLVTALSSVRTKQHQEIMQSVFDELKQDGAVTFAKARALRLRDAKVAASE